LVESRIRKNIRTRYPFRNGDRILTVGELSDYVVKRIIRNMPVTSEAVLRLKIAEVTLRYSQKKFHTFPWTYRDYASPEYEKIFLEIRKRHHLLQSRVGLLK